MPPSMVVCAADETRKGNNKDGGLQQKHVSEAIHILNERK